MNFGQTLSDGFECRLPASEREQILKKCFLDAKGNLGPILKDTKKFEESLLPLDVVINSSDRINFRNYSGLAVALIYSGERLKGQALFKKLVDSRKFSKASDSFLLANLSADISLFYYYQAEYALSKNFIQQAISISDEDLSGAPKVNLIGFYVCAIAISEKLDDPSESSYYIQKINALAKTVRRTTPSAAGKQLSR